MEEISEKLKLLNYERKFKPIPKLFFAIPSKGNPIEQFHMFVALTSWLLSDVLKVSGFEVPDQFDDPNVTSTNISKCVIELVFYFAQSLRS